MRRLFLGPIAKKPTPPSYSHTLRLHPKVMDVEINTCCHVCCCAPERGVKGVPYTEVIDLKRKGFDGKVLVVDDCCTRCCGGSYIKGPFSTQIPMGDDSETIMPQWGCNRKLNEEIAEEINTRFSYWVEEREDAAAAKRKEAENDYLQEGPGGGPDSGGETEDEGDGGGKDKDKEKSEKKKEKKEKKERKKSKESQNSKDSDATAATASGQEAPTQQAMVSPKESKTSKTSKSSANTQTPAQTVSVTDAPTQQTMVAPSAEDGGIDASTQQTMVAPSADDAEDGGVT